MWPCAGLCPDQTAKKLRARLRPATAPRRGRSPVTEMKRARRMRNGNSSDHRTPPANHRGERLGNGSPVSNDLPPARVSTPAISRRRALERAVHWFSVDPRLDGESPHAIDFDHAL